jgi:hypothetical protein
MIMEHCEYLSTCPFFAETLPEMPSMAQFLKSVYCLHEPEKCARLMVRQAVGKGKVPLDLFPDEAEKAIKIISDFTTAAP